MATEDEFSHIISQFHVADFAMSCNEEVAVLKQIIHGDGDEDLILGQADQSKQSTDTYIMASSSSSRQQKAQTKAEVVAAQQQQDSMSPFQFGVVDSKQRTSVFSQPKQQALGERRASVTIKRPHIAIETTYSADNNNNSNKYILMDSRITGDDDWAFTAPSNNAANVDLHLHSDDDEAHSVTSTSPDIPSRRLLSQPSEPSLVSSSSSPDAHHSDGHHSDGHHSDGDASKLHMKGESRLRINFIEYGHLGMVPQRFGKAGGGIPDGLCGTTQVYEQHWRFRVSHHTVESTVRIRWHIENIASGTVVEVTETENDAKIRSRSGRTICNIVLKKAFELRAQELELELPALMENKGKYSKMQTLIKALRPNRCTVGLLFFGLLHECVQIRWEDELKKRKNMY